MTVELPESHRFDDTACRECGKKLKWVGNGNYQCRKGHTYSEALLDILSKPIDFSKYNLERHRFDEPMLNPADWVSDGGGLRYQPKRNKIPYYDGDCCGHY